MGNVEIETKHHVQADMAPPTSSVGAVGWVKKNLFSSWLNTLLTIVSAFIAFYVIKGTVSWVFVTAEWSVISSNFRLLMVGQFTVEQLWRVWVGLLIVSTLLGLSWGIWKGTTSRVAITISGVMAVMAIVPFVQTNTRIWLVANLLLMGIAYFIGAKFSRLKTAVIVGWFLFFPVVIFFLNGFGVLQPVSTNLWGGFLLTLLISLVSIVVSFPFGILLALGRRSNLPFVKWFSIAYIELIRGIPLITVLFISQLMLPLFLGDGIQLDNVLRSMIGFTMFSAAYLAENIRGGLQSIPRGQFEAAHALGLNSTYMMAFVIMPQALRAVIPAMVGQFIGIFKDTVLVAIVGLIDLLGMGKKIIANPKFLGTQMEVFVFVAFVFFIFCYLMSYVSRRMEVALGVGER